MSVDIVDLKAELAQFSGSSQFYMANKRIILTDGMKYFCDKVGGYWIVDIVASVLPLLGSEEFVVVSVNVADTKADVTIDDGGKNGGRKVLYQQKIDYTDCPEGDWKFYKDGDVMMLPTEY